jgi:hypothetical protein
MTALNGLTRPWDAFIETICARKEKLQFDSLWEECVQEEARVTNREAVLLRDEDQALTTHTKGGKRRSHFKKETHPHKESHSPNRIHKESHPLRRFQKFQKGQIREKDFSSYQCYHCDKMRHVIHRIVLAGFEDEPPEPEQTDAQKSEFTDSTGLLDHLFSAFPSLRGIVINDLSMKVVKDYWPPKTWARACTLECFFSFVNYFLPAFVGD